MTSSSATDIKDILLAEAKRYLDYGRKVVTINGKKPTLVEWTPLRDMEISIEQVREWLSSPLAERIAVLLDKSLLAFDYDGAGEYAFWKRMVPRCNPELQEAFHKTTLTKTPHGGHVLFGIDVNDFPEGLRETQCWWNGKEHNQVILLSQNKYLIERGIGYQCKRGIETLVTLDIKLILELISLLKRIRSEIVAIKKCVDVLQHYYYNTNRNNLTFSLSGFLRKGDVPEYLIKDLQEYLMDITGTDTEDERRERFNVIKNTCSKDRSSGDVSGMEIFLQSVNNDDNLLLTIQNALRPLGYFKGSNSTNNRNNNNNKNDSKDNQDSKDKSVKLSAEVIKLLEPRIELLFKNKTDDKAFAAIHVNGHREIVPVYKSKRFDLWVRKTYYDETGGDTLGSEVLKEVVETLESKASLDGDTIDLQLRVSKPNDNNSTYYYDLTNKSWQAVKITQNGWGIEDSANTPIMFVRHRNQIAQVLPSKQYSSDILDRFVSILNVKDDDSKLLLKCYVISLFIPAIPKPVLMLHGEQGAAKTALEELIRSVVDPSSAPTLVFPRTIEELIQQLSHNYLAYYDNVSTISDWISDQLCRAVTGSGFSKRELYSDDNDIIYNFRRAIGFNGVNLAASRADLLDRGIIIELERILENKRLKEQDVKAQLDAIKSQLLGFIFDVLAEVIKVQSNGGIKLDSRTRMADFEEYAELISRVLGHRSNDFIEAYRTNRRTQTDVVIEGSPLAAAIIKLLDEPNYKENGFSGTSTDLLTELESYAEKFKINTKIKSWPKSPNALSLRLNQIKTNLRDFGIEISYAKDPVTRVKRWKLLFRPVKDRSDRSDRSEGKNHAQNEPKSPNDLSNDHSNTKNRSFGEDTENHAQITSNKQYCERSNDVNDVIRISFSDDQKRIQDEPKYEYLEALKAYRCLECRGIYSIDTKDMNESHPCNNRAKGGASN
jgi:hypothetical protein